MDLTQGTEKEKNERSKKMMLWFGIISLLMAFAAWTSAYIVSSTREDWIRDLDLPLSFYISCGVIVLSSLTYILARNAIRDNSSKKCTAWLLATMGLGIVFVLLQFQGFSDMVANGFYFTGPTSSIKYSYIFLIVMVHVVHVAVGMISLGVVLYNQIKGTYVPDNYLGLSLGLTYWHFLDLLWLYLLLFMTFVE